MSKITDFDQVKDHIICKLVNAEMNSDYLADKPGKAERGEKKPERERVSMKEKLPEKKAEVAKTKQTGSIRYQARRRRRLWDNAQGSFKEVNDRLGQSSGCPGRF